MTLSSRWLIVTVALTLGWGASHPALVVLPEPRAALAALNGDREHFACMHGVVIGRTAIIWSVAPASAGLRGSGVRQDSTAKSWAVEVVCKGPFVIGLAHNHPVVGALVEAASTAWAVNPVLPVTDSTSLDPRRCWFKFPNTTMPTTDWIAFQASGLPLTVIVCGDRIVWALR